jgi:peptidoglycan/LPS O-acetylase OafA/YrhL
MSCAPGAGPHVAPYSLLCVEGTPGTPSRQPGALTAPIAYLLLFALGALEGLIGSFEFPRSVGAFPLAALAFCVLILATCLLGGLGMGTPLGGLLPAVGWFLTSFVLTLPTAGGSVIVTDTTAGKWYLYGGAVSAGLGIAISFRARSRARRVPPGGPGA